ncbi:hypothetical protein JTE90_025681 [Oedothorax gibbosus]|uniref:Uncharacterized protein n=1 Tax=Oedothorax gibbosus TaxID=931172 RepID=A0AAV6UB14_9ARAC|nr:hypothetical protein JTE90_025681 [Oedothorax gibbosus]
MPNIGPHSKITKGGGKWRSRNTHLFLKQIDLEGMGAKRQTILRRFETNDIGGKEEISFHRFALFEGEGVKKNVCTRRKLSAPTSSVFGRYICGREHPSSKSILTDDLF